MADYAAKPTKAKEDTAIIELRKRMLGVFLNRCRRMKEIREDGVWWRFLDPNVSWVCESDVDYGLCNREILTMPTNIRAKFFTRRLLPPYQRITYKLPPSIPPIPRPLISGYRSLRRLRN